MQQKTSRLNKAQSSWFILPIWNQSHSLNSTRLRAIELPHLPRREDAAHIEADANGALGHPAGAAGGRSRRVPHRSLDKLEKPALERLRVLRRKCDAQVPNTMFDTLERKHLVGRSSRVRGRGGPAAEAAGAQEGPAAEAAGGGRRPKQPGDRRPKQPGVRRPKQPGRGQAGSLRRSAAGAAEGAGSAGKAEAARTIAARVAAVQQDHWA